MTKKIYLETLKNVLGRSIFHYYFGPYFPAFRLNTDQNNSVWTLFTQCVMLLLLQFLEKFHAAFLRIHYEH